MEEKAKLIIGSKPKQKELLTGQILERNGHDVLFLPETGFVDIPNPDVLIDYDIIADLKVPDGNSFNAIRGAIRDADSQNVSHMVFYPRSYSYTKEAAIKEIANRLKNTKKLKEVWLIWEGIETIVKK